MDTLKGFAGQAVDKAQKDVTDAKKGWWRLSVVASAVLFGVLLPEWFATAS